MRHSLLCVVACTLLSASGAFAGLLYDNTTTDTGDTVLYSGGPFTGLGDQIHLVSPGTAATALLQMYNAAAGSGTFDVSLRFYQVGSPVGSQIGGTFSLTGVPTTGQDIINLQFALGGLPLPQDAIFVVSVANATGGADLGVNMFEPPTVGSSDNSFLIAQDGGGFSQEATNSENVYFQLRDASAPEPATWSLMAGALAVGDCYANAGEARSRESQQAAAVSGSR